MDQVVTAVAGTAGGCAFITADHGNAEKMMKPDGTFTAHYHQRGALCVAVAQQRGSCAENSTCLADIAPTMLPYIGLPVPLR